MVRSLSCLCCRGCSRGGSRNRLPVSLGLLHPESVFSNCPLVDFWLLSYLISMFANEFYLLERKGFVAQWGDVPLYNVPAILLLTCSLFYNCLSVCPFIRLSILLSLCPSKISTQPGRTRTAPLAKTWPHSGGSRIRLRTTERGSPLPLPQLQVSDFCLNKFTALFCKSLLRIKKIVGIEDLDHVDRLANVGPMDAGDPGIGLARMAGMGQGTKEQLVPKKLSLIDNNTNLHTPE